MTTPRNLSYLADNISVAGYVPITSISEVQISNPANNESLIYDTTTGKWKNGTGSGASTPSGISDKANTSTGYLAIPKGTTAERPANPDYGYMRYNTTTGFAEVYTAGGWTVMGASPPTITTVTPATYNGESGTLFTINGTNFTSDAVVKFIDVNNTEFTAALVTFVNSTQLLATTPQDFTVAQEPLDVRVSQISGTVNKLDCIDTGGSPSWTTAAGQIGGTIYRNGSVNTSVAATDPDTSATISYLVYSGALPSGLSLNANTGAITGTAPNVGSDTTYNFTIRVTDNAGNTADRAFSISVLQGSPAAPTVGTATRSASQSVQVAFTAPVNPGGSAITSYTATSNPGGLTGTSATSPITVSGLTNGTSYTFTVTATNSYGTGAASSASNSTTPYGVPNAPTIGTATSTGTTTATVAFTASFNGGSTITSYTAVSNPGSITGTLNQAGSGTITISGLTAGTSYTFTVYATNAAGNSATSSASNNITTTQVAPTSVEYLVVAGGGGGGGRHGGAGGAGQYLASSLSVSASTNYTVTIGGGGAGGLSNSGAGDMGQPGNNSVFANITSLAGGFGAGFPGGGMAVNGGSGGSGGGGWHDGAGGSGTTGGNNGGRGAYGGVWGGGGGGGAGSAGGDGGSGSGGGAGGTGLSNSITGTSIFYAGGGGGGAWAYGPTGSGGSGSGGAGSSSGTKGTAGTSNTGGGGGGGGYSDPPDAGGGLGGSGVVIIAYPNTFKTPTISGGLSYDEPSRSGYRVYRFTGGTGTISW